jgi:hypothetical protein
MGGVMAVVGLTFSMLAIRLMMMVENTQIVVVGVLGQQLPKKPRAIVFAIGEKKFYLLKMGITLFVKISSLIFVLQEMYIEKNVQGAASTMMTTIMTSNKMVGNTATKYTKHAVRGVKKRVVHHYNTRKR